MTGPAGYISQTVGRLSLVRFTSRPLIIDGKQHALQPLTHFWCTNFKKQNLDLSVSGEFEGLIKEENDVKCLLYSDTVMALNNI